MAKGKLGAEFMHACLKQKCKVPFLSCTRFRLTSDHKVGLVDEVLSRFNMKECLVQ